MSSNRAAVSACIRRVTGVAPWGTRSSSFPGYLFWPKLHDNCIKILRAVEELKPLNETRKLHFLQFIDGGTGGGTQAARR